MDASFVADNRHRYLGTMMPSGASTPSLTIGDLNDRFRRLGQGNGRVFVTAGVEARGPAFVSEAICAVRSDDTFEAPNDPYGERDFGVVPVKGTRVFWKLDYFDRTLLAGSEDPASEIKTCRVLAVRPAQEY